MITGGLQTGQPGFSDRCRGRTVFAPLGLKFNVFDVLPLIQKFLEQMQFPHHPVGLIFIQKPVLFLSGRADSGIDADVNGSGKVLLCQKVASSGVSG